MALVERFVLRLSGAAPTTGDDSAFRKRAELKALVEQDDVSTHASAQKILQATVELIMKDGANGASHRKVAVAAGVSVSSVQHFFGARENFIEAAFRAVYRRSVSKAVPESLPAKSMSVNQTLERISRASPSENAALAQEFNMMLGLILSAAYEPGTRAVAQGLIARFGASSYRILNALEAPRGVISRLDGQIQSMIGNQSQTLGLFYDDVGVRTIQDFASKVMRRLFV